MNHIVVADENSISRSEALTKLKGIASSAWRTDFFEETQWGSGRFCKLRMTMAATDSEGAAVRVGFFAEGTYMGSLSERQGGELLNISMSVGGKTVYSIKGLYSGTNNQENPQQDLFNHDIWKLIGEPAYQQRNQPSPGAAGQTPGVKPSVSATLIL